MDSSNSIPHHTTPFAQQSPPPRKKKSTSTLGPLDLSSSTFEHTKKQKHRSEIPLQWRVGRLSLVQPVGDHNHPPDTIFERFQSLANPSNQSSTSKLSDILKSTNSPATMSTAQSHLKKISSVTKSLRSHSISSDNSSASSTSLSSSSSSSSSSAPSPPLDSTSSQSDLHQSSSDSSIIHSSFEILPNSDHILLGTLSWTGSNTTSTHLNTFNSSSSSFHPSVSQHTTHSPFESLEYNEGYPTSSSHPLPSFRTCQANHSTSSPSPESMCISNSFHHPTSAPQSSISLPLQYHNQHSPQSPSTLSHVTCPSSATDLPFAGPSPVMPSRHFKSRPRRPVPTGAPPLPRSQTPSLVIRPKFPLNSHLDLSIQPVPFRCSSNTTFQSASTHSCVDLKACGPGWAASPTSPMCLFHFPSPTLPHLAPSSASSIDSTTPELLTPHSLEHAQTVSTHNRSSTSPRRVPLLRTQTQKFRDCFALSNAAPLKINKRQKTHHSNHPSLTSDGGRRVVSDLFNALSPTSASHMIGRAADARRKAEFKKTISYPVLNHSSSDDTLSDYWHEEHHDDHHTNCCNLTIEAAVCSLEGIRSHGLSPRMVQRVPSNLLPNHSPQGVETQSIHLNTESDSSAAEAQNNCNITEVITPVWKQKLRRHMSGKPLLTKSSWNIDADDGIQSDCPSAGISRQPKGTHRQLRHKAAARLKPLLRRVSSLSLKQRGYLSENETGPMFEPSKIGNAVDEDSDEELVMISADDMCSLSELNCELKTDGRFQWIRSSVSKKKNARSVPSSAIDLTTPKRHQNRPLIKSSQSICEKRKLFEQEVNDQLNSSLADLSSLSASSFTPSDQPTRLSARLTADPAGNKRLSVLSQRQAPNRKPTPAEIKLKDEARSVKALVNKFEHQSHISLSRSVISDCLTGGTSQCAWDGGRPSSIGLVRNSLTSIWSGSSTSQKNMLSRRSSRQLAQEQRRKRRGWSSGNTLSGSSGCTRKGKKKKSLKTRSQIMFKNNNSSFSSFGCDLQERDKEDYGTGPIGDHTELTDSHESNSPCLAMILSTSSNHDTQSTWSGISSCDAPGQNLEEKPHNGNCQSSQSSPNNVNVGINGLGSCSSDNQVEQECKPQPPNDLQLSEPENENENTTWSMLSSEQAHTVLEPRTVWMGDGSARKILVVGGRLQMAKKIPFPSFEDDAEFSQPVNLQQDPPASRENLSPKPTNQTVEKNKQSNRISSFLRTRKFDNDELEADEDRLKDCPGGCYIPIGFNSTRNDLGGTMMCAADIASLQDSPTHGRGRQSLPRPMLLSGSESSHSGSPERSRLSPHLLLGPAANVGQKNQHQSRPSGTDSPNSVEIKQMYLSVGRCQGLGNKMFGSSIDNQHRCSSVSPGRWSGCRSASAVVSCVLAGVTPNRPRPQSQPPLPTSQVSTILDGFDAFGSVKVNQIRSRLTSTYNRSSILDCDMLDCAQNENLTAITDIMDSHDGIITLERSMHLDGLASVTQVNLEACNIMTSLVSHNDTRNNLELNTMSADQVLRSELARLQCVQERWHKFCLEVEDVLKKSRERWPSHVEPDKALGEFSAPTAQSTFDTFLVHSQKGSLQANSTGLPQHSPEDVNYQLTPPSKHPFDSQPINPSTKAGYPSLNDSSCRTQKLPHIVTLPVPSAFVSPNKFLGSDKIPKIGSEQGPRVLKKSNQSQHHDVRLYTLSNRLRSTGSKPVTERHQPARMISVTSSHGSFTPGRKVVLAEKSVNQSPVTLDNPICDLDTTSKISLSPKVAGQHNVKSIGSLGRMNRPSIGKWGQENEGSLWTSATMRETRKPWKRSVLNHNPTGFNAAQDGLLNSSFTSHGSSEEVGVLVADGDQSNECSNGFHTSGSLRLKHLRRLNQSRSDRSIGKAAQRIQSKASKTELGVIYNLQKG